MSNDQRLVALALAALSGCAAEQALSPTTEAPRTAPAADPVARVDENVARLQALRVVEVSALTQYGPPEANYCYGPCPGFAQQIADDRARSAARLDALVPIAERAMREGDADPAQCTPAAVDRNLDALRALHVVNVRVLVETVPENEARCYNLPCPDAVARASAENCERASALARIVAGASTALR